MDVWHGSKYAGEYTCMESNQKSSANKLSLYYHYV